MLPVVVALVIYIFLPSIVRDLDMLGGILRSVSEGSKPMPRFVLVAVDFIERYFDPRQSGVAARRLPDYRFAEQRLILA